MTKNTRLGRKKKQTNNTPQVDWEASQRQERTGVASNAHKRAFLSIHCRTRLCCNASPVGSEHVHAVCARGTNLKCDHTSSDAQWCHHVLLELNPAVTAEVPPCPRVSGVPQRSNPKRPQKGLPNLWYDGTSLKASSTRARCMTWPAPYRDTGQVALCRSGWAQPL